ncbi:methylated-DNA--[protein]-cysteine S-methyltransferase [Lachnospiraceae bacterium OttesenSCG-928-D06]|nr:methylated-DNA--[protein]-cysteine S-methyltransferase [Lachnospiraceae bacterium OttesenSCG-928-D06]
MYYQTNYPSPVGTITLACDKERENLVGLWIDGQKYHGGLDTKAMETQDDLPIFTLTKQWMNAYFAGKKPAISQLPLRPTGSSFRQEVWKILCEIPYGEVTTYGKIAKILAVKMGKDSMSSQAVGGAVGHNPISIIIPCHRVVGTNGSLTGYAGGIQTKIKLLELEGADLSNLFIPKKGTAL